MKLVKKVDALTWDFGIYAVTLVARRNFERQGKASAKPDGIVTYVEGDKSKL